jgi:hypothetical protein
MPNVDRVSCHGLGVGLTYNSVWAGPSSLTVANGDKLLSIWFQ